MEILGEVYDILTVKEWENLLTRRLGGKYGIWIGKGHFPYSESWLWMGDGLIILNKVASDKAGWVQILPKRWY